MRKNRKLLFLLVLVLSISMIACGPADKPKEETSMEVAEEEPADTQEETKEEPKEEKEKEEIKEVSLDEQVNKYFDEMPKHIYKIAQDEFVQKVKNEEDIVILDIRRKSDYDKGHIKGAVNLPWGDAIAENLKNIPSDKEVYVYCYSGQTAGQAVHTLNVAGFNARSVNLGWNFGISKVDGVDEVVVTDSNELAGDTKIASNVQSALDEYYKGLSDVSDTKFKNYKVSEDNLKEMVDNNEDFYLLSIRQKDAYDEGHISGANLIAWEKGMQTRFSRLPKDKKIVVYCYSGQTAGQTTAALKLLGYDAVSLNGGMGVGSNAPLGWTNKEYQTEKTTALQRNIYDYFANKPDHSYMIAQDEMVQKVKNDEDVFVLDIRRKSDYDKGHLKGAVNAPWGETIAKNLKNIPSDKEVYVYCYSGQTAGQAVNTLNIAGFNARSVKYGWNFGISKVDGVDEVTETAVNDFPEVDTAIDSQIQIALDEYYKGLSEVKDTKYKNYKISEDNLKEMIENEEDFSLVSFRTKKDYNEGHIKGASLLSYGKDMHLEFSNLDRDKLIVGYCYSGQTAGQAVAALRLLSFDAVSLNGGMGTSGNEPLGWTNKGYEVVK
ncbi:MAG: rhodanese-like domain-containing protein [Bacillota bacterium]